MADWKSLLDENGEFEFKAKPPKDLTPGRRDKLIESINAALKAAPKVSNGRVEIALKIGSKPFQIDGFKKFYPLEAAWKATLEDLKKAAANGDLDKHIQDSFPDVHYERSGGGKKMTLDKPKSTRGGAGKTRGPMSQETKDKIGAKRAGISVEEYLKRKVG